MTYRLTPVAYVTCLKVPSTYECRYVIDLLRLSPIIISTEIFPLLDNLTVLCFINPVEFRGNHQVSGHLQGLTYNGDTLNFLN